MANNLFITHNKEAPARWRLAFPTAVIHNAIPSEIDSDTVVWLHNLSLAKLRPQLPQGIPIVVLHDAPVDAAGLEALSAGAVGFAHAHATPELLQTIERVVRNNGLWVGEALLNRLLRNFTGAASSTTAALTPTPNLALQKLSERERQVALKVAVGENNKEIAQALNIAERTVKAHLTTIFNKLGARDRLHLALLLQAAT